jgi:hypothetical protein
MQILQERKSAPIAMVFELGSRPEWPLLHTKHEIGGGLHGDEIKIRSSAVIRRYRCLDTV